MSLIGKTFGHYSVSTLIGRGGMGEVYRARDQKLGRDVAIKVLPEEFARDADRVARFQREAKLLASLNHPNIAAIHGLEESDGTQFLVLELVEGETLADQIKKSPIPVEEALKLSLQIAEALEAAHEKGVIHRDLKPANLKSTPDGKVKVLDFGLAKAYAGDREEVNLSNSPTLSDAATQQGVILGTAAYMPPEQAKGKAVDKRADIWAFGVILFEMLTGRQVFTGETVSETLAAVLKSEPEWNRLPPNLHPRIRFLLERCLEKDVKNRYSSIGDARVDIQKVLADPNGLLVWPVTSVEPRKRLQTMLPWLAAAVVLTAIIAIVAVWKFKPSEPRQVIRLDYELPEGQQLGGISAGSLAVSPDGKQLVYSTTKGLYLRSVDELTAKIIAGTEGTTELPFFSSDGKWIGYYSSDDRKLKKIAINGGAPVALCDAAQFGGASWHEDNTIIYSQGIDGHIMRVSANGGTPEPLIKAKSGWTHFPQILPDGKSVLYTAVASSHLTAMIMVQSLKPGETKELFAGVGARYLPTRHIVYAVGNNLLAVPFDSSRLEKTAGPVPIVEGVFRIFGPQYALSDSGTLAYIPGKTGADAAGRSLVWVDRQGKEDPLAAPPNNIYRYPKISPDGTQVALSGEIGGTQNIWIWDLRRKALTRLTFDEGLDLVPIWTPDGKRIVFYSLAGDSSGLYWKAADGTGEVERLISNPERYFFPCSWSRDGKILLMDEGVTLANTDIGMLSMDGDRTRKPLLKEERASEIEPMISPDGQWMAYSSNESGHHEVYVRPFPEVNKGRWQVSTSGGESPLWSPDGRELFYLSGNSAMAVVVGTEPTFSRGTPKILFRGTYVRPGTTDGIPWDIHPDGKRFLMIKEGGAATPAEGEPRRINIVLNWLEELKQRVLVK